MADRKCSTCIHILVCGHWRDYLNASRSDTRLLCGHLLPEWRGDNAEVVQAAMDFYDAVQKRCRAAGGEIETDSGVALVDLAHAAEILEAKARAAVEHSREE